METFFFTFYFILLFFQREWISVATCVYLMDRFITDYNNDDDLTVKLLDQFEIHILPVFNPDGYEYSFKVICFSYLDKPVV